MGMMEPGFVFGQQQQQQQQRQQRVERRERSGRGRKRGGKVRKRVD
jgi:hypothetical protein